MGWTGWRYLANKREWFDNTLDHDGPACYELGMGGPRGGKIQAHYVGETLCERDRVCAYARSGSHLGQIICQHLNDGWHLYYRAWAHPTKAAAKVMQDRLLARHRYDWNDKLNRD